ncbi:dihydrolipoyl dehydrogenase [Azospira inquinata]|uniref:Dihydrolipoyl dehydrogenase n=1 Tax=Azospira inquinata TaxID=2785627 RepID=A0A975SNN4_9RHOO|nr:dihydrolipoyl dehydrogenase [Azospira inquinata]QWT44949.1 dihydrolipoyl dehydrogenase [Azospira inquinata]QWT49719.1 dihydrolipoyl dehydrogenase [Azospira inquinata]
MDLIEVKVPDIGDFKDVPVIELLVKAGDTVQVDDALVTLESDKATMDVPAPTAGIIREVKVQLGDRVSEGSVIALVEAVATTASSQGESAPAAPAAAPTPTASAPAPEAGSFAGQADVSCDMVVLGAGPGGYSAAFRAADLGLSTVLVERYPTLGGVCLNVGCIPSKALLHVAQVLEEAQHLSAAGVSFGAPQVDLDKLREHKNRVVGKLTGGLAGMAKGRKVQHLQGLGRFLDPHHLEVTAADGTRQVVRFQKAIIAAGSQPVALPFMPKDDPRVVDSTGALELRTLPKKMLVIGGGIIGLEMATVYSALGARITVVELGPKLMPGADRDLVKVWEKKNAPRFDRILLGTGVTAAEAKPEGVEVTYSTGEKEAFDLVLVAVGRTPNGKKIAAEAAGVAVTERGFINVDAQLRTNVPHIFAIGDIVGQPMLAHKAVHEAHVAAEVAAGEVQGKAELARAAFDVLQIPSVAYTHPEIAWAGKTEEQLKADGVAYEKALFPWAASGRAIANGAEDGFTKLLFDQASQRLLGGGIVGMGAGDLIGEVCLAVEMGCDAVDMGKTIHPHPTLCESVGLAAEAAHGSCTDLPPARKK